MPKKPCKPWEAQVEEKNNIKKGKGLLTLIHGAALYFYYFLWF